MVIFVNVHAGGGTAAQKWERFCDPRADLVRNAEIHFTTSLSDLNVCFTRALSEGHTEFVAAGGDGTVSSLLQLLIHQLPSYPNVTLGAIGLGSSNDFHKPRANKSQIPAKLDFTNAKSRDVGSVTYLSPTGSVETRYWLLNASIGVTAEANAFFNLSSAGSRILRSLKRHNTNLAILYAALHTIIRYRNRPCSIQIGSLTFVSKITNLGVLKSPHFAGDFTYDAPLDLASGSFPVRLAHDLTRLQLLKLMFDLFRARFGSSPTRDCTEATTLRITSPEPFALEFDGEVIRTTDVSFDILPHFLKVAP